MVARELVATPRREKDDDNARYAHARAALVECHAHACADAIFPRTAQRNCAGTTIRVRVCARVYGPLCVSAADTAPFTL